MVDGEGKMLSLEMIQGSYLHFVDVRVATAGIQNDRGSFYSSNEMLR